MFATRFWSPGYGDSLETLFTKLSQGVAENSELIALAQARADAEEAHGARLAAVAEQLVPKAAGFARDDGATMRKAYEGVLGQMNEEGRQHSHVAESIRRMVVEPFTKWAAQHKIRIDTSRTELRRLVKVYERELAEVHRAQQRYFNRCRLEEDASSAKDKKPGDDTSSDHTKSSSPNEAASSTAPDTTVNDGDTTTGSGASGTSGASPAAAATATAADPSSRPDESGDDSSTSAPTAGSAAPEATSEELELAGHVYSAEESQLLIARMLSEIPQQSTRVTILGTYDHTVTGAALTQWLQQNTHASSLDQAEAAGQKLVQDGFLRLIGQVGSRFVNSSVFTYQWRHKAWQFAGISSTIPEAGSSAAGTAAQQFYADLASRWAARADPAAQSVRELDQKYRKAVAILDNARVDLESSVFEHLAYLERAERERLVAFKAVLLDFAAAVSNVVPALSASVDRLLLYHEAADVDRDLRFLVENYQTGHYDPKVVVYDNYYSSTDGASVFGLDLDLRARADKRRVPYIVAAILGRIDECYPQMENDEERLAVWQTPMHARMRDAQTLRRALNATGADFREALSNQDPLVVVQVFKLYLLELPTSVIAGQFYDILRSIYLKFNNDTDSRLQALQNTLAQLTLSHIATLDAITAHIKRLVTIANASPKDVDQISSELGPALCRPKVQNALSLDDTFSEQVFKDLVNERERIFSELKRHAMLSPSVSTSSRRSRGGSRAASLSARTAAPQGGRPRESSLRDASYGHPYGSQYQDSGSASSLASAPVEGMRASSSSSIGPDSTRGRNMSVSSAPLAANGPGQRATSVPAASDSFGPDASASFDSSLPTVVSALDTLDVANDSRGDITDVEERAEKQ